MASLSIEEGRGAEFVSVYVPQESSVDNIVANLKCELDSVEIKYEDARDVMNRLQEALKNVIQRLKMLKEIPENGYALFAGTFSANDLEVEMLNVEELVPPEPIVAYLCRVDNHFHLEPLREMLRSQKVVGILTVDSKEASFGLLSGERFDFIENITSGIHGKSGKGGSSQRRYERERDMAVTYFFHRIAEHATKDFLEIHKVTALAVGGPGPTKQDFLKGDFLNYELKNRLVSVVDTQSTSQEGVREVLEKSADALKNMCAPEEKMMMQRFLGELGKEHGLATYGLDSVLTALNRSEVEVALVTDCTDMTEIVAVCKRCGYLRAKIVPKAHKQLTIQEMASHPCEKCRGVEYIVEEKDIVDVLEDLASQTNAAVEVISTESEEKARLAALGGFGAILRYNPR